MGQNLAAKYRCINSFMPLHGGSFEMGSNSCMFEDESPQHTVSVGDFEILVFEVTNNDFLKWAKGRGKTYPYLDELKKKAKFNPCFPVEKVNWYLANQYCKSIGGRLPTEAEWEYAASINVSEKNGKYRWNSGDFYPDSNQSSQNQTSGFENIDDSELENLSDEEIERLIEGELNKKKNEGRTGLASVPRPVQDSYKGLNSIHGMMGSMWEWVADSYGPYVNTSQVNPINSERSAWRVIRGGSYQNIKQKDLMRTTVRNKLKPGAALLHVGFRCVRSAKSLN